MQHERTPPPPPPTSNTYLTLKTFTNPSSLPFPQMLFTWSTENLCIVFPQWRVTGTLSLLLSLLGVMALTAGYEALREASRRYERRQAATIDGMPRKSTLSLPRPFLRYLAT